MMIAMVAAPELPLADVPPGHWAVGVSGGADSVALLLALVRQPPHMRLHVAHLNHETRGAESDADSRFVAELAARLGVPSTIRRRTELEPSVPALPTNPSARYRALRFALFADICRTHSLDGVLLAHHADDQAETVLQRLLRGSGLPGLAGILHETNVGALRVIRPLLPLRRARIRKFLQESREPWREDASNRSQTYLRNRLRQLLARREQLAAALLETGRAAADVRNWAQRTAPNLAEHFAVGELSALPSLLSDVAIRRWLLLRGVPAAAIEPAVVGRIVTMAEDAASPPLVNLPGGVVARRRAGMIGSGRTAAREDE